MNEAKVSVVLCTYNGSRFIREQLDSILSQTRPADEIIIQDDGSTDETFTILLDYQQKHREIRVFRNEGEKGVNSNFFSAMRRATGDFLAISDQDDIWMSDKLERQLHAIGDKLLCAGRSMPFSSTGADFQTDSRMPNYSLLRLLFISGVSGHTLFFSKDLLRLMPDVRQIAALRYYDAILLMVAAAYESIVYLGGEPLVRHRMHTDSASYAKPMSDRKSLGNIVGAMMRTWRFYRELSPLIRQRLKTHKLFLSQIESQTEELREALSLLRLQTRRGFFNFMALQLFCMKHCDKLFYARKKKSLFLLLRGAYFPVSCSDYFRYLSKRV